MNRSDQRRVYKRKVVGDRAVRTAVRAPAAIVWGLCDSERRREQSVPNYLMSRRVRPRFVILILSLLPSLVVPACRGDAGQDRNARGATTATVGPEEEPVRFANGSTSLAGTLFWPARRADGSAVVVLAGSERSERGGLRIAIARQFVIHGLAAMVYDRPGTDRRLSVWRIGIVEVGGWAGADGKVRIGNDRARSLRSFTSTPGPANNIGI